MSTSPRAGRRVFVATLCAAALASLVACEGMEGRHDATSPAPSLWNAAGGGGGIPPRSAHIDGPDRAPAGGLAGGAPPPDFTHAGGGAPPPDAPRAPGNTGDDALFKSVSVFFGTDRAENPGAEPNQRFTAEMSDLKYGVCTVTIPKTHKRGAMEEPHWWRFEIAENPRKHVVLKDVNVLPRDDFARTLGAIASRERNLMLFIHGYNVDFRDAARRTAQIAYDVGYPGVPVLYSWPSHGTTAGYGMDEDNAKLARPHLEEFLSTLASASGVDRLDVVAHSMGNRVLCEALANLARARSDIKIRHLVLAAPDIDSRLFVSELWPQLRTMCEDVTLYASSDDEALKASSSFHGNRRVGQSRPDIVLLDGLWTIDATGIDTSLLGHSYVGAVGKVLDDLKAYLAQLKAPVDRGLTRCVLGRLAYWTFP